MSTSRKIGHEEVNELTETSAKNNQRKHVTGVLLHLGSIFFQVIEGPVEAIDELWAKILADPRHEEVVVLKTELDVQHRLFGTWSMRIVDLNRLQELDEKELNEVVLEPVRVLLQTVTESYSILEKYTQATIFKIMQSGINPLTVAPRKCDKVVLFCDIVGFSTICEALEVEHMIVLVNSFFDAVTRNVSKFGGEVTKFIGDCVMAYFDGSQADAALNCALAIVQEVDHLRHGASDNDPTKILYCGIGINRGTVIEGNIGSAIKKDYTLLGDAVNIAARLESSTRDQKHSLVFSESVKQMTHLEWQFCELGSLTPRGRKSEIRIYSLNDPAISSAGTGQDIMQQIGTFIERYTAADDERV
jgi:class 3 adenylate cyclase